MLAIVTSSCISNTSTESSWVPMAHGLTSQQLLPSASMLEYGNRPDCMVPVPYHVGDQVSIYIYLDWDVALDFLFFFFRNAI